MPPKRSRAPRQTKLDFSPKPKPKPTASVRQISPSSDESPVQPSKKRKLDLGRETERGMKLGLPISSNPMGMFGSSDNEAFSGASSSSESEEIPDKGPATRRKKQTAIRRSPVPAPVKANKSAKKTFVVPQEISSRSEDDSEEQIPRKRKPKMQQRPVKPVRAKRRQKSPELVELSTDEEEEEEEQSDSEEDVPRKTKRPEVDPQEQEDLEDDLEFLQSSPPAAKAGLRSRYTRPLTQREKTLEALKRKRGSTGGEPSSSATTPGRKRAIVLSDSDDSELEVIAEEDSDVEEDELNEDEDDEEEDESDGAVTPETNALDMFHEDVNDVEFIDDDGNIPIGAPSDHASIPIEFTALSRAKPRELFKYAVEWMVHKKINPAFPRDDEIYTLTFRKLDDEVNGLANSKFSSSIWAPDFTRALRARPNILLNELGEHLKAVMSPHCEACNRKTHPASWEISLTGSPYNKDTLEPITADSDSDSDSDSSASSSSSNDSEANLNGEKPTYNATGERIPPESKTFTLGSTCKANAQMAHTLHHWRYHLNSWVVDYLVREGHCTPEKVIERDSWREKKRAKAANKIVDKMQKEGEIKSLHKLYKAQVDYAFEAKNDYQQGWGRR
ncbi:hypothetical protein K504DRAFT_493759 [Pleomassaria siparia CBS 279.74]|uniref:DUF4211 domain-containing protein n=1 Tax=Pleomassaria siparia CBS 279.74 TaxID=1314801 RepID=A0A6G1K0J5_9PLEO|nr:hypothetical protein K504DRAFT_493759 [Pleomassaria siparia CBS 279.74]